eukprot:1053323-Amphidinium_carterae.1
MFVRARRTPQHPQTQRIDHKLLQSIIGWHMAQTDRSDTWALQLDVKVTPENRKVVRHCMSRTSTLPRLSSFRKHMP